MAKDINGAIGNLAAIAKNSVEKIDVEAAKKKMVQASKEISENPYCKAFESKNGLGLKCLAIRLHQYLLPQKLPQQVDVPICCVA